MNRTTSILLAVACVGAVLLRLVQLPVGYNFSALGALALFCGCLIRRPWLAIALPLLSRAFTDVWLQLKTGHGFYDSMVFDYTAYAGICLLGRAIRPRSPLSVVSGGIASAAIFFLVSNFGVWVLAADHGYERSMNGLLLCYVKGIAFARGTFAGDILFSIVLFGAWNVLVSPAAEATTRRGDVSSAGNTDMTAAVPTSSE